MPIQPTAIPTVVQEAKAPGGYAAGSLLSDEGEIRGEKDGRVDCANHLFLLSSPGCEIGVQYLDNSGPPITIKNLVPLRMPNRPSIERAEGRTPAIRFCDVLTKKAFFSSPGSFHQGRRGRGNTVRIDPTQWVLDSP